MISKIINNKKVYRRIAVGLIVFSFLLYAIMPLNLCLPLSYCIITAITVVMMAISEISFWAGGAMLGKEAMAQLRKKIKISEILNKLKNKRR